MSENRSKKILKQGGTVIGCGLQHLGSQDTIRVLAGAGLDWLFVDAEHGGFGQETIKDICRYSSRLGVTPVVRVADLQYALIARALDCGAEGIIFPRVESPELLEHAADWTKFPPLGSRGCGLAPMMFDYEVSSVPDMMRHANDNTLVVVQIESLRALQAREELLSVRHLDAVLIGPVDLSISLGVPGEFMHPKMLDAISSIIESCNARGIAPGGHFRNAEIGKYWKDRGVRLLSCSGETAMLHERASEIVSQLR
jgi:2-dehydro-3-deoxyglucarate aldolase/4-hydroxy-2-oxoheptanedioate aldolase